MIPDHADEPQKLDRLQTAEAASTLSSAFTDDPLYTYLLPDEGLRPCVLPLLMRAHIELLLPDGHAYYISQPSHAVALLQPPGRREIPRSRILLAILKYGVRFRPSSIRRMLQVLSELEQHRLQEEHYYLMMLGVAPSIQRKGLGSLFLRFVTQLADERGLALQLETAEPKNIHFYAAFGCEACSAFRCDKGRGPQVHVMRRLPKPTPRTCR